jgi:ubiquinone biosynthesis protein Coq4
MLGAFVALVRDPQKTEKIFELTNISKGGRKQRVATAMMLRPFLQSDDFKSLYSEEYNPPIDMGWLRKLPEGTFGRAFANFIDANGFQADGFPPVELNSPISYLVIRIRRTHDLMHVLTGYDVTLQDELALQGFTFAQTRTPVSALIIAGGIIHLIFLRPAELVSCFDKIIQGYIKGKYCKNLLISRLEDHWTKDLYQMRIEYGLAS